MTSSDLLKHLAKKLEIGSADEREYAIRQISQLENPECHSILSKIAADPHEFPYIRQLAQSASSELKIKVLERKLVKPFLNFPPKTLDNKEPPKPPKSESEIFLESLKKNKDADFSIYYIRVICNGRRFYKIGVTTSTVIRRYQEESTKIDKILLEEKVIGALAIEKQVIEKNNKYLFPLAFFKRANGHTEFFDRDVLGLDQ